MSQVLHYRRETRCARLACEAVHNEQDATELCDELFSFKVQPPLGWVTLNGRLYCSLACVAAVVEGLRN